MLLLVVWRRGRGLAVACGGARGPYGFDFGVVASVFWRLVGVCRRGRGAGLRCLGVFACGCGAWAPYCLGGEPACNSGGASRLAVFSKFHSMKKQ